MKNFLITFIIASTFAVSAKAAWTYPRCYASCTEDKCRNLAHGKKCIDNCTSGIEKCEKAYNERVQAMLDMQKMAVAEMAGETFKRGKAAAVQLSRDLIAQQKRDAAAHAGEAGYGLTPAERQKVIKAPEPAAAEPVSSPAVKTENQLIAVNKAVVSNLLEKMAKKIEKCEIIDDLCKTDKEMDGYEAKCSADGMVQSACRELRADKATIEDETKNILETKGNIGPVTLKRAREFKAYFMVA